MKNIKSTMENLGLLRQMVQRDFDARYRGSIFGVLWHFMNPLLMLAMYTFVFAILFKAKWPNMDSNQGLEGSAGFALMIFSGMIIHSFFVEVLQKSATIIVNNSNYVKKVIFPLEIFPLAIVGGALLNLAIGIMILLGFAFLSGVAPSVYLLFLPITLLPLVLISLGISWMLASLGVFIRDIGNVISLLAAALLFLSPVFYPLAQIPERYRDFAYLNPLTITIEEMRKALFYSQAPDIIMLLIQSLAGVAIVAIGFAWFAKSRKGFADIL
jgi:lipopolysaccharide transport system permease protein